MSDPLTSPVGHLESYQVLPSQSPQPTWNQARPNHIQGLLSRIRSSPQSSGQIPLRGQVIEQPQEFLAATTHTLLAVSLNEYLLFFSPRIPLHPPLPQHYSYSQLLQHLASGYTVLGNGVFLQAGYAGLHLLSTLMPSPKYLFRKEMNQGCSELGVTSEVINSCSLPWHWSTSTALSICNCMASARAGDRTQVL